MPLQLVFEGGATLDATDAFLIRGMGAPVRWHFIAEVKPDEYGGPQEVEKAFVKALLGGAVTVKALWQPGGIVVCPGAKVVGANRPGQTEAAQIDWQGYVGRIDILAESTAPAPSRISPFVPRRRVLQATNMAQLVQMFSNIAQPLQRVTAKLQTITFPDGDRTSIIQDGVSDWVFFGQILDQCRFLAPTANWLPLSLVGSVNENEGTANKWVVTPGVRDPYVEWNYPSDTKVVFDDSDGAERFLYGQLAGPARVPAYPSGAFPVAGVGRPWRTFDAQKWQNWRTLDVPRFTAQGDIVWRIQDRIFFGHQNSIGWETFLFAAPPEAQITGPYTPSRLMPWTGTGQVSQMDTGGPWIHVKIDGFEEGADTADVRISTPYSGTDGKKGLHFVPEQGTKVELCWPGRFDTSVVLFGNTRWDQADFPSPSIYLQATHTARYEDIHIKKVGQVGIDSSLSVGVQQSTTLNSQQPLDVKADGADLNMRGGIVYTGRGM